MAEQGGSARQSPLSGSASAGTRIRRLRVALGLTTRDVENRSHEIATDRNEQEYLISHSRLVQIEAGQSTPGLHKLYTLAAIYGVALTDLISLYVDIDQISAYHLRHGLPETHLMEFEAPNLEDTVKFPLRFDPAFSFDKTNLIHRMVDLWGHIPLRLLKNLSVHNSRYGFIGLSDYTMYPILRPGSFVEIDQTQKIAARPVPSATEFDRPIYFIQLRTGYICSWCEIQNARLISIPHPLSSCKTRVFAHPSEAEIVGRVTAVAIRLIPSLKRPQGIASE